VWISLAMGITDCSAVVWWSSSMWMSLALLTRLLRYEASLTVFIVGQTTWSVATVGSTSHLRDHPNAACEAIPASYSSCAFAVPPETQTIKIEINHRRGEQVCQQPG